MLADVLELPEIKRLGLKYAEAFHDVDLDYIAAHDALARALHEKAPEADIRTMQVDQYFKDDEPYHGVYLSVVSTCRDGTPTTEHLGIIVCDIE